MGCMVTYASYFNRETDLRRTAVNVAVLDTLVALLAGLAIFPAAYSVGIFSSAEVPTAGPDLVFITLPAIFDSMTWGGLWASVFFLLLVVAALTSTLSLHEVVTAYLHEEWHLSRKGAAGLTTVSMLFLSALASLSLGMLNGWRICGLTIFDSLDFLTANILMPAGGLLTSLFVGWVLDRRLLRRRPVDSAARLHAALGLPGHSDGRIPGQSGAAVAAALLRLTLPALFGREFAFLS